MTDIQIILLFTTTERLPLSVRNEIERIVREEYSAIYQIEKEQVRTVIYSGNRKGTDDTDILLAIQQGKIYLNEGARRNNLKERVERCFFPLFRNMPEYSGKVRLKDGLLPVPEQPKTEQDEELDYSKRAQNYKAEEPKWTFESVQIPEETYQQIDMAIKRIEKEREVFEEWGLYGIMPNPSAALSFFGPPGTGKTMAADAVAAKLKKKIIRASYAEIESKYHGEGPKNVSALFLAAEQQDAVLFIDEADSLLSKRLTNVTQGSEQAINSMRSQLLICLEKYHGVVIFATNLVVNYDNAFVSRLIGIPFSLPDANLREKIWYAHTKPVSGAKVQVKIPLAADVDLKKLAQDYEVCGREIRNAVVNACVEARTRGDNIVCQAQFEKAIQMEIKRRKQVINAHDHTATNSEQWQMTSKVIQNMVKDEAVPVVSMRKEESTEN